MTPLVKNIDSILVDDFNNNSTQLGNGEPEELKQLRQQAIRHFKEQGIPGIKNENWRFTNIKKLLEKAGRLDHCLTPPNDVNQPMEEVFQCDITELDTYDLALVDGWFPRSLPLIQTLDGGIKTGSLKEATELYPELVLPHYGKIAPTDQDAFTALNTAFAQDGIFAWFPQNSQADKPIQVVNLVLETDHRFLTPFVHMRNLIVVEKNSHARIVLCDHTLSSDQSFATSVTEISIGENARVELVRVQNQNSQAVQVSSIYVHQKEGSEFTSNTITLNGGFLRNNQYVELQEPHSVANLFGCFLVDRKQHVDNNTFIHHRVPDCESNELFKGILDEEAHGVFKGLILVDKDAQRTNSYQKNNNLLLTDKAMMNTLPQLEIYADDVKCSHGATVGYLNDDEHFYLVSRGINPREARLMLMNAFAAEIVRKLQVPALRDRISYLILKRLRGELTHCNSCVIRCRE